MDDLIIRNINRRRTTLNRYVSDNNAYWREELHARVEDLPQIGAIAKSVIDERIAGNVWGFPVDEQSTSNTKEVFYSIINDYLRFTAGRRVWAYTETAGRWTEAKIAEVFAYALIMRLWDIGRVMLVENYPLISDDLRLRSGTNYIKDNRETYHDSINKLGTASRQYTQQDNTRNKIAEHEGSASSDTSNERSTSNNTNIQDSFLSPQNQGVTPSKQSDKVMDRTETFQTPDNMGVEELKPNGDPLYTTATVNNFTGETNTNEEGRTSTNQRNYNRVDEREYNEGNDTQESTINGENNVGARAGTDAGHERQETLDVAGVLQHFYTLFSEPLLMALDNAMLPYFLNMKIARFKDHRLERKEYA